MPLEDVYIRSDAVVARMIGGETLAIPVRGGIGDLASIYRFNKIGTMIWEALGKPMILKDLVHLTADFEDQVPAVHLIERNYEVSEKSVHDDVALFLTEMRSADLLTVANVAGTSDHATLKMDHDEQVGASSAL